jgi:hypothetical protein
LIEVVYREGIVFIVLAEYVRYVGVRVRRIKWVGRGGKGGRERWQLWEARRAGIEGRRDG